MIGGISPRLTRYGVVQTVKNSARLNFLFFVIPRCPRLRQELRPLSSSSLFIFIFIFVFPFAFTTSVNTQVVLFVVFFLPLARQDIRLFLSNSLFLLTHDHYDTTAMESLLNQSRAMCPFLKRTSPAALRSLSMVAKPSSGPRGGTMSNLQVIARRCPVMSKALAVQSSRLASKNFSTVGAMSAAGKLKSLEKVSRCPLHTTAGNGARVEADVTYEKSSQRKYQPQLPELDFCRQPNPCLWTNASSPRRSSSVHRCQQAGSRQT